MKAKITKHDKDTVDIDITQGEKPKPIELDWECLHCGAWVERLKYCPVCGEQRGRR